MDDALKKAVSRLRGRKLAETLSQGRRNPVRDPAACWTQVDNGASSKGRRYRAWQCKSPVVGIVSGRCYCAEHIDAAREAEARHRADREFVRARGINPDTLDAA